MVPGFGSLFWQQGDVTGLLREEPDFRSNGAQVLAAK